MKPAALLAPAFLLAALLLAACEKQQDPDTPVTPQESSVRDKANADVAAALAEAEKQP